MFRSICDLYYNQYSYWLYKDVHVNLCFIRLVDISSLLVPCVLCRAKYNRQWSNREYASDTQMEIQPNVKYFCLFVCKIKNFVNTWYCSINTIFKLCQDISTCLETERKAHQRLNFLPTVFLKLVQINLIFANNVHILSICMV
jgi:hypothetical protein